MCRKMNAIKSKIKAVMLGHAVADALGVPVEFQRREELKENPVTDMRGYGTYAVPEGCWSDDTSMSIAALDVLAKDGLDYDKIMNNFTLWCKEGAYTPTGSLFDIGFTCRSAILSYKTAENDPLLCGLTDSSSNGNGSLMRIHPFVLYAVYNAPDRLSDIAFDASSLTHAHMRSKVGCGIYAEILRALLDSPSKETVVEAIKRAKERYADEKEAEHYSRVLSLEILDADEDSIKSSGYVVDTLEAALWCLFNSDSYSEAVLKAVNLGSDTDTVAAVTGGLAGALYGYDGIPKKWLKVLKRRKYIEGMCSSAARAWRRQR